MKLIDADELKKDDEINLWLSNDSVRTGKTLKMFSELFIKKIDEQTPIQAVPMDTIDKIRAEIEALPKTYPFVNHIDTYIKEDDVKKIIDKYIEREG